MPAMLSLSGEEVRAEQAYSPNRIVERHPPFAGKLHGKLKNNIKRKLS
jgi:hypothetical protein